MATAALESDKRQLKDIVMPTTPAPGRNLCLIARTWHGAREALEYASGMIKGHVGPLFTAYCTELMCRMDAAREHLRGHMQPCIDCLKGLTKQSLEKACGNGPPPTFDIVEFGSYSYLCPCPLSDMDLLIVVHGTFNAEDVIGTLANIMSSESGKNAAFAMSHGQ